MEGAGREETTAEGETEDVEEEDLGGAEEGEEVEAETEVMTKKTLRQDLNACSWPSCYFGA